MPGAISAKGNIKARKHKASRKEERFVVSKIKLPELYSTIEELKLQIQMVEKWHRELGRRSKRGKGVVVKIADCEAWLETRRAMLKKAEHSLSLRTRQPEWTPDVSKKVITFSYTEEKYLRRLEEEERRKKAYAIFKQNLKLDITVRIELGESVCRMEGDEPCLLDEVLNWKDLQHNLKLDYRLLLQFNLAEAARRVLRRDLNYEIALQRICKELQIGEIEAKFLIEK